MKYNIFTFLKNLSERQRQIISQQKELSKIAQENVWANVFHDSIRGYPHLENLPLNIGRWAGNYSFFYLLFRILKDFEPTNILDLGLGESSKFISTFLKHNLPNSRHTIGEHDPEWISFFEANFSLPQQSVIKELTITKKIIDGAEVNAYEDFENTFKEWYDFILIDAPFGSPKHSRHDVLAYIAQTDFNRDFVIVLDDTNRFGEQQTLQAIVSELKQQRSDIYTATYSGMKSSTVITNKKFLISI